MEMKPTPQEKYLRYFEQHADLVIGRIEEYRESPRSKFAELDAYMLPFWPFQSLRDDPGFKVLFQEYKVAPSEVERRRARDFIIYSNIRLVLSVALGRTGQGLPLLDLMQEGVLGMMIALEKFDPDIEGGGQFSTYAFHWIKQAMRRAIQEMDERRPFRIPVHLRDRMNVVRKAIDAFIRKYNRMPSGIEIFKTVRTFDTKIAAQMRLRDVMRCWHLIVQGYESLDQPVNGQDGDEQSLGEVFSTLGSPKTETVVEARHYLKKYQAILASVETIINEFDVREAMILRFRLGLAGFERMTLEEIGERYELTRERIRQIEKKAIKQLAQRLSCSFEDILRLVDVMDELGKIATSV